MKHSTHAIENEEVMAYLDGELPVARAAVVAGHLSQCAECQAFVEDLRGLSQQMLAWEVEPQPERLAERVTAAVAERTQRKSPAGGFFRIIPSERRLVRVWAFGLGGAILGAALVVLLIGGLHEYERATMVLPIAGRSSPGWVEMQASVRDKAVGGVVGGIGNTPPANSRALKRDYDTQAAMGSGTLGRLSVGGSGGNEYDHEALENSTGTPIPSGPMIVRTASLSLVTKEFAKTRKAIEQTVRQHRGYVAQLSIAGQPGAEHVLAATLRLPGDQLEASLAELRSLGRLTQESQGGEEVTQRYVDLSARLSNARTTEQRLIDVLRERTGKVRDILAVEQEIARVRGEIEEMEAEKKSLEKQVSFATVQLQVNEEYKAQLEITPPSAGTVVRNTLVEGYRRMLDGVLAVVLGLFAYGPMLVFWSLLFFWPARLLWRRSRVWWTAIARTRTGQPEPSR